MSEGKLSWQQTGHQAKASYSIPYVGEVSLNVEAELPGAGDLQTPEEQKELALRHAKLLVRSLAHELDRQSSLTVTKVSSRS
jgi:hypothetical protein